MSVSVYMKGDYEEFHALRRRKNKANSKPIARLWPEIRNKTNGCQMAALKAQYTESHLKKQSQFAGGTNYANSVITMVYEGFSGPRRRKNKANSNPIKPNFKITDFCNKDQ